MPVLRRLSSRELAVGTPRSAACEFNFRLKQKNLTQSGDGFRGPSGLGCTIIGKNRRLSCRRLSSRGAKFEAHFGCRLVPHPLDWDQVWLVEASILLGSRGVDLPSITSKLDAIQNMAVLEKAEHTTHQAS